MNCDEYLPLISGHLDGVNSEFEERRLQEHLHTCEDCRALLSQMKANDALLKEGAAVPPVDLTDRIMRQVRKEKRTASSKKTRWIPVAVSGLAVAALLSFVIWGNLPVMNVFKGAASADSAVQYEPEASVEAADEVANGSLPDVPANETSALLDAPTMTEALAITEAPVVSDASVITDGPAEGDGAVDSEGGKDLFIPEFPAYGYINDNTLTTTGLPQRSTTYRPSAPMLIIWGTDSMEALADYAPEALDEYTPLTAKLAPSLYERYQALLPLLRDFDHICPDDGYGITVYTVPYETMMAAFSESAGVYENAIYYPAAFTTPDACFVVLVNLAE